MRYLYLNYIAIQNFCENVLLERWAKTELALATEQAMGVQDYQGNSEVAAYCQNF